MKRTLLLISTIFLLVVVWPGSASVQANELKRDETVQAYIGQKVQVDVSGLQAPGVSVGAGVYASGTIVAIDPVARLITVQLYATFSGRNMVTVPPDRVKAQ